VSDQKLVVLQVNARFHTDDNTNPWGEQFITAAGSAGLTPGAATDVLRVAAPHGYTGDGVQLMAPHFAATTVELVANTGASSGRRSASSPSSVRS